MSYTLITANRNYSSWSLRPWLLMKALGIAFEDRLEPFTKPDNYDDFRAFSPTGQVPLLMVGTLGMAASFGWLGLMAPGQGYATAVLAPMLLNGISAGLTFMPVTSLVLSGVEPEHAGYASGLLQTAQQLGGAVGLAVIVSVYAANDRPGEFLPGTTEAFLTSSLFAVVAFLIGATVVRRRRFAAEPECVEVVEQQLEAA